MAYVAGEYFRDHNMMVTATYSDGTRKNVQWDTLDPGIMQMGVTKVTVTYQGLSSTIPVTVVQCYPESMEIWAQPEKTDYVVGEEFDPLGLNVCVVYNTINGNSGRREWPMNYDWSPKRFEQPGEQYVTISYTENGKTATGHVQVNVTVK